MATPYSYYPIPKTGVGFHDSSNTGAIPANLDVWAQAMAAEGVSVYKVLADGVNKVNMAAALVRAGIVPIVRLYGHQPHPRLTVHPGWVAPYVAAGARLFEWGNEPNIGGDEWENGTFPPRSEFGRLIGEQWIRNAAQIRSEGGIPMFVAMTPGGYHDHRTAYRQILDYLHSAGKLGTLEQAALAIHPRPHTVPPHVPPTDALTVAFKEYEWIAGLFQTYLGWVPPMYATEHGYSPNDSTPTGYPPIDENQAAAYNRVLFEMMNPAHPDKCPRYLLGLAYWLETEGGTWVRDEAFRHRFPGEPTVWGHTFLAMNINWDRRAYVTGGTAPPPPPEPLPPPPGDDIQLPAWCSVTRAVVPAGGRYWHLKRAYWQDSDTSGGTHHIYALNPHDATVEIVANVEGTSVVIRARLDKPANEPAGNIAMTGGGNRYRAALEGGGTILSDSVSGMTMPQNQHVSYFLEWEQRVRGDGVIDLWSNHHSSRAGQAPKYVILHSTASPAGSTLASTAAYLKQNDRGVSIHELVGDATVYRMVTDDRAAHHAEAPTAQLPGGEPNYLNNELTWGIEGFQIGATPVSAAVARLMLERVVLACRRLGIPSARVLAHREIDPTRRTDPLGIEMGQFRAAVAAALNEVPTPPPPPPDDTVLKQLLLDEAERRVVLRFNPSAAIQRAIFAGDFDQFTPNSPEFTLAHEGKTYVAQRAENGRGVVRVYFALMGDWGNVKYAERAA
jgi:hypothetical protein